MENAGVFPLLKEKKYTIERYISLGFMLKFKCTWSFVRNENLTTRTRGGEFLFLAMLAFTINYTAIVIVPS